jgi:hypothetical protein
MKLDHYNAQRVLNQLLASLTDNQVAFLEARLEAENDKEAFDAIQMNRQNKQRWLEDDPVFAEAYELVVTFPRKIPDEVMLGPVEDVKALAEEQLKLFASKLPKVLERLFTIAEFSNREGDSLKAIDMIMRYLGVDQSQVQNAQTAFQVQVNSWAKPQELPDGAYIEESNTLEIKQ